MFKTDCLVALKVENPLKALAAGSKDLPTRLKVFPWGAHSTMKGNVVAGPATLQHLAANQKKTGFNIVALDFNHNTVPGTEAYRGEPAKIAAKGTPELVEGEGVFLSALEWTPEGREHALGGHYPDLSITAALNADGEIIFMHSAALCRQSAVTDADLHVFSADAFPKLAALAADPKPQSKTSPAMDYKKLLLTLLSLPETATDPEIQSACEKFAADEGDEGTASTVATLSSQVARLFQRDEARERAAIVDRATREGKAIPAAWLPGADGKGGLPLTALSAGIADLPVTVPVERRTPNAVALAASGLGAGEASSAEAQVKKNLGISDEAWKKHNP